MSTTDHRNVEIVRRGFDAMGTGDIESVMSLYAPELRYFGGDQLGRIRRWATRW